MIFICSQHAIMDLEADALILPHGSPHAVHVHPRLRAPGPKEAKD